jgi:hypothetical protein
VCIFAILSQFRAFGGRFQLPMGSGAVCGSAAHYFVDADSHDDAGVIGVLGQLERIDSSSEFISKRSCLEQLRFSIETDVPRLSLWIEADDRDLRVVPQVGEMATAGVLQICQVAGVSDEHASFRTNVWPSVLAAGRYEGRPAVGECAIDCRGVPC